MKVLSGGRNRTRDARTMERERLYEGVFSVWQTSATFDVPFVRHMQVQEGSLWAGFCIAGSVIAPTADSGRILCSRAQFLVGQGPLNAYLAYGRGTHSWVEFEFPLEEIRLIRNLTPLRPGTTIIGGIADIEQWEDATADTKPGANLRWMAMFLDALSRTDEPGMYFRLSSPLRELTLSVVEDPAHPWTLQEAAYQAGYSPYHLSRAFKRQMGVGFPIFVQRCRAHAAFSYIVSGEESADTVAQACGFGHAHAMRVALKSYCGFLPNEIRTLDVGIA